MIDYIENKLYFFVKFEDDLNDFVISDQSALYAANVYQKEMNKCQTSQIEENSPKRIKKNITKYFDLTLTLIYEIPDNKEINITNTEIIESVTKSIRMDAYRLI
ncbi:15213_t:CDS:2 [Cetraspora pellucida]|uniref:15213_t:CDS:1 n=1 Tax=Cetraspora pellucida TaxID=1433469 RepID=A0A9N9C434_9GLOM|nr:15213_t:CDS:2 [Cetraspora pellucida]